MIWVSEGCFIYIYLCFLSSLSPALKFIAFSVLASRSNLILLLQRNHRSSIQQCVLYNSVMVTLFLCFFLAHRFLCPWILGARAFMEM